GPENNHPNTSFLTSPPIAITQNGGLGILFSHRYSFEYGTNGRRWDGGQLRVSLNGGPFQPVPANAFIQNGYGNTVVDGGSASILHGQPAFTGESTNHAGGFITSVAILGSFRTTDVVRVQFVAGGDTNTRGLVSCWEINLVEISRSLDVRW